MEQQIKDFLTIAECDYIETIKNDNENPIIKYYCECANETSNSWILIQNNPKCMNCDDENRPAEKDIKYVKRGLSLGFKDVKIPKTPVATKISFVCKCGERITVDSQTFNKVEYKMCDGCKIGGRKSMRESNGELRGFTEVEYIEEKSSRNKMIWKVKFTCTCGNYGGIVKSETFEKEDFAGCANCSSQAKSERIKATLGSITEDKMREEMSEKGFHNLILVSGNTKRTYIVEYNCRCKNVVKKTWRSVESDPLCIKCMKYRKKAEKDGEIKKYLEKLGYVCLDIDRVGDKRIIMVKFECKCGNEKTSHWDVISRAGFSGCEECADMVRIRNMIENTHSESANKKRMETNMANRGVPYNLQDPEVKDQIRNTNRAKYGVENPSQSDEIKQKKKDTCMINYGVESPLQSEYIRDKVKSTNLSLYGEDNPSKVDSIHLTQQTFKEYTSTSGRIYKYQGYEHYAINKLIVENIAEETDIDTCYDVITKGEMPRFVYVTDDGSEHRYRPDIRIRNADGSYYFIEVKSNSDTFCKNLDIKLQSVVNSGYKILLWRFSQYGKITENSLYG